MRFNRLTIKNYKSLRDVTIRPREQLSVFVGPNAAGKTNLSEALDFLGEVYRYGIEVAIARKGGYENIAFRRARRAKGAISFSLEMEVPFRSSHRKAPVMTENRTLNIEHIFEFRAKSEKIDAPFSITQEVVRIRGPKSMPLHPDALQKEDARPLLYQITRRGESYEVEITKSRGNRALLIEAMRVPLFYFQQKFQRERTVPSTQLIFSSLSPLFFLRRLLDFGEIKLFQLNPRACRESGVPSPNPELSRFGGNLPAVVSYLAREHRGILEEIVPVLAQIYPGLDKVSIDYTHTKTLALFLREKGFRRPWSSEDVSDGTIQSLAILAALFDPRHAFVVIEELENSLHPWGIRTLVEAVRNASKKRQVVLTTHSPIIVDSVTPEEVSVVSRDALGHTQVTPLLTLSPNVLKNWSDGKYLLSDHLDKGQVPAWVPPA